jgi:hypothetical protein
MGKRVADLLVETLQAASVRTSYGIVGDTGEVIVEGQS